MHVEEIEGTHPTRADSLFTLKKEKKGWVVTH